MVESAEAFVGANYPFAYRDFRLFWAARLTSMLAMSCLVLAIGWEVYDLARQTMGIRDASLRLGLIGLFQFLPILVCTPVAGVVVDKAERSIVLRFALALQACGSATLAAMAHAGMSTIMAVYGVAMLLGTARSFLLPSMNALAPAMVPREVLPRAIATNAMAGRAGAILGPVIGGFAYAIAPWAAFALALVLLLVAIVCISLIRHRGGQASRSGGRPWQMISEGLAYVRRNRLLTGTISLDLFAMLLGGTTALLPVYARDILHVGPAGLGYLRAAPALGALATAAWYSWRPPSTHMGRNMLIAVALFGLTTIGFGFATALPVSLAMLAISGGADMVSVVTRQSLMQLHTPDDMRGRVGAISALSISTTNELGEAESGFLAALMGPVGAVVAGGVGALVITGLWVRLFPELLQDRSPIRSAR